MTVEEALVALLAAVAGIMLFFGLAQALDTRPSRHAHPRRCEHHGRQPTRAAGPVGTAAGLLAARSTDEPLVETAEPHSETVADWVGGSMASIDAPPLPPTAAPIDEMPRAEPAQTKIPPPVGPASARAPRDAGVALVETCAVLYLAGKHAELLVAAEPRLGRLQEEDPPSPAETALWSLAALSRQALGDEAGARAAFAGAFGELPQPIAESCPPRLAAVSVPVARRLLEMGEQSPEAAEVRLMAPRLAAFWLRWRLVVHPGDHDAQVLLEAAREALSEGYADVVSGLIRCQEWLHAHRLIQHGRERDELPQAPGEVLVQALADSLRHEIERLTAPIIRGAKDEGGAATALERAETMLASMVGSGLPSRQVMSMSRRIWRGYARLGMRKLRAGSLEGAGSALFRAFGMKGIGRRRQRHVREALVRMLEVMGDQKLDAITKLLAEDDQLGALDQVEQLIACIERARNGGVPQKHLTVASAKATYLARLVESHPAS